MNKSLTLLEAMERAEGKNTTLAFCSNVLVNPIDDNYIKDIKKKESRYTLKTVIGMGFYWSETKEGQEFWERVSERSDGETLYGLSFSMIEDYVTKNLNNKPIIPWLKALEIGEDYVKHADTRPAITKQKTLKEPNMAMIAPFNKGKLNIKGIIHQSAKGILDTRPFIKDLIEEEFHRISSQIKHTPTDEFKYSGYNIKIHHYVNQMLAFKRLLDIDSPTPVSPLFMVDFYAYEKLLEEEDNYGWIASYLTQENMQKPEVTLFESNKLRIFLNNGYIYLKDITKNILYSTPVKYNSSTNTFHL